MSLTWISGPGTLTQKTHPFTTASGPNICWLLPSNAPQHGPFISDGVHAINQLPGRRPPQTTRVMSVSPPGQQSSIVRLPRDSLNQDTHSSPCLLLSTPQSLNLGSFGASFLLARPSQGALPGSVETLLQSTSICDIMMPINAHQAVRAGGCHFCLLHRWFLSSRGAGGTEAILWSEDQQPLPCEPCGVLHCVTERWSAPSPYQSPSPHLEDERWTRWSLVSSSSDVFMVPSKALFVVMYPQGKPFVFLKTLSYVGRPEWPR